MSFMSFLYFMNYIFLSFTTTQPSCNMMEARIYLICKPFWADTSIFNCCHISNLMHF